MKFSNHCEAIAYFKKAQDQITAADQNLKALAAKYKKETKEYFGIEDGQTMNLIELASMIQMLSDKPAIVKSGSSFSDAEGVPV